MPTLASKRLGECTYEEKERLDFPNGLPGYEHLRYFVLVQPDPELPLSVLQSIEDEEVSFVATSPFLFYPNYSFDLNESYRERIQLQEEDKEKNLHIYVILSLQEPFQKTTMNLLAPIVINSRTRLGVQAVLHGVPYTTRHPLFADADSAGKE